MHLADVLIQSDLQLYIYCPYVCSLGIEPTTFALLTQCSTTDALPRLKVVDAVIPIFVHIRPKSSRVAVKSAV